MNDDDEPKLGPCCGCGSDEHVVNVLMLPRRAPVAGTGWGCAVCGLPGDGAVAVLCDACISAAVEPRFVCHGYATGTERVPVAELAREVFDHDAAAPCHAPPVEPRELRP
jgi:hypothetical protein